MNDEISSKCCKLDLSANDDTLLCDICCKWTFTDCLKINKKQHQMLQRDTSPWHCLACKEEFSFSKETWWKTKNYLYELISSDKILRTFNQPQKTETDSKTNEKLNHFLQISQIVDGTELDTSQDFHDFKDFNKFPIKEKI